MYESEKQRDDHDNVDDRQRVCDKKYTGFRRRVFRENAGSNGNPVDELKKEHEQYGHVNRKKQLLCFLCDAGTHWFDDRKWDTEYDQECYDRGKCLVVITEFVYFFEVFHWGKCWMFPDVLDVRGAYWSTRQVFIGRSVMPSV